MSEPIFSVYHLLVCVVIGVLLGIGVTLAWTTPEVLPEQPTEVVHVDRPLEPKDVEPSRDANVEPEREVVYQRIPTKPIIVEVPVAGPVQVRDSLVVIRDSVTNEVVRVDTLVLPDFDLLGRGPGVVDLTAQRLRLTVFNPDVRAYQQRFYTVPERPEPLFGYRVTAFAEAGISPLVLDGPTYSAGGEVEGRIANVLLYGRGHIEVPNLTPGATVGIRLRLFGR